MADVLSFGPGDGPGDGQPRPPRRRWSTRLTGGLVAAGVAYLAVHTDGGPARREPPPLSVVVRPAPDPVPTGPFARPSAFRLDGDPGAGPSGQKLLVGGLEPFVLDAGTGSLSRLPIPLATGDLAELDQAGGTTTVLLRTMARLRSRAVALRPAGRVTQFGPVLDLVPLRDGSVLTEDCTGAGATGPCTLTGRAATGAVRWRRTVPWQLDLVRDTPYGLLVRTYEGEPPGAIRLENVRTGAPVRVIGRTDAVLGADDRQVVLRPAACGPECALTLADLATGASRSLPGSPGNPTVAAFSPDGRRLAVSYAGLAPEDPNPTRQRDGYVVVVDLAAAGRPRTVPDLSTGPNSTALPVWARDGRLLLAVPTDEHGSGRVALWTPGTTRLTLLPVALTGFYGSPGEILLLT